MTNPRHSLFQAAREERFAFSGKQRQIAQVEPYPFRWPTKTRLANEYVQFWQQAAASALAELRLSRHTLDTIASHTSRRDGTCRLTDKSLSGRSGRSVASTERDIRRLKSLGFLLSEYEGGDRTQQRVRLLRVAFPLAGRSPQRIPTPEAEEVPSTYPPCVEGHDTGARRDV